MWVTCRDAMGFKADGRCSCKGGPACARAGKHPLTEHGLKDATVDEATIRQWWTRWPCANIGIPTGASIGAIVVDTDSREAEAQVEEWIREQATPPTPPTVTSRTGNGYHRFYKHPGGIVGNKVALGGLRGLDLRGDGGYVVAPPSRHASGRRYVWECHPWEAEVAACPAWLLKLLQPAQPTPHEPSASPPAGTLLPPQDAGRCMLCRLVNVGLIMCSAGPASVRRPARASGEARASAPSQSETRCVTVRRRYLRLSHAKQGTIGGQSNSSDLLEIYSPVVERMLPVSHGVTHEPPRLARDKMLGPGPVSPHRRYDHSVLTVIYIPTRAVLLGRSTSQGKFYEMISYVK